MVVRVELDPSIIPNINITGGGGDSDRKDSDTQYQDAQRVYEFYATLYNQHPEDFAEQFNRARQQLAIAELDNAIFNGDITTNEQLLDALEMMPEGLFSEEQLNAMETDGIGAIQELIDANAAYWERLENQQIMEDLYDKMVSMGVAPDIGSGIPRWGDVGKLAEDLGFEAFDRTTQQLTGMNTARQNGGVGWLGFNSNGMAGNYSTAADGSKIVTLADGTTTVSTQSDLNVQGDARVPTGYQGPESSFPVGQSNYTNFGPNPYMAGHGNPDPRVKIGQMIAAGSLTPAEAMALGMTQDLRPETLDAARQEATENFYDLSDPTQMKQIMTFAAMFGYDYADVLDSFVNHNAYYFPDREQPDPNYNWIYETEPQNEAEEWLYGTLAQTFPEETYFSDTAPAADEDPSEPAGTDEDRSDPATTAEEGAFGGLYDSTPTETEQETQEGTTETTTMTREQIEQLISDALGNLDIPSPRTDAEIQALIDAAIAAIPADTVRSDEEINNLISNAVSDFITAADLPADQVRSDEEIQALIDASMPEDTVRSDEEIQALIDASEFLTSDQVSGFMDEDAVLNLIEEKIAEIEDPDIPNSDEILEIARQVLEEIPEEQFDDRIYDILREELANYLTLEDLPEDQVRSDEDILGLVDTSLETALQELPEFQSFLQSLQRSEEDLRDIVIENISIEDLGGLSQEDIQKLIETGTLSEEDIQKLIDATSVTITEEYTEAITALQRQYELEVEALREQYSTDFEGLEAAITALENQYTTDLQALETQFDERITGVETTFNTNLTDLRTDLEEDITNVESDITDIEEDITDIEEDITGIEGDVTDIEEDVGNLNAQVAQIEIDYRTAISDLEAQYEEDLEALETELGDDIDALTEAVDELTTQYQADLAALDETLSTRITEVETAFNTDLTDVQEQIQTVETTVNERIDDVNNTFTNLYNDLVTDYEADVEAINSSITDLTERADLLEERDSQFEEEMTALETAYTEAINAAQTETEENFRQILESYVTGEELQATLEDYVTEENLDATLRDYVNQTQNQYEALVDQQQDLVNMLQQADNQYEVDALSTQIDDMQGQIDAFLNQTGYDPDTGTVDLRDVEGGGAGTGTGDGSGTGTGTGGGSGYGGGDSGMGDGTEDTSGRDYGTGGGGTGTGTGGGGDDTFPGGGGGTGGGVDNGGDIPPGGPSTGPGGGVDNGGGDDPYIPEEDEDFRRYPYDPGFDYEASGTGGWFPVRYTADPVYQYGQPNREPERTPLGLTSLQQPFNPLGQRYNPSPQYNMGGQVMDPNMSMNHMMGQAGGIQSLTNFQTNVSPFQQAFRPNVRRYN